MSLLATECLGVSIAGYPVCRDLELDVSPGESWAVLGRNGVGKTTLLHTLAGLRAPDTGTIRLDGRPLSGLSRRQTARRLGLLPQDSHDPFPASVLETALIGRHPHLPPWEWEGEDDRRLARRALGDVGLAGLESRDVTTLSGGERRRLAAATLLTQAPGVYLLDEPTNHLDPHHQIGLLELLRRRALETDAALVMTLHDVNLAARFCDRVLLVYGEGCVDRGPTGELLDAGRLERLYRHPVRIVEDGSRRAFLPG